MTWSKLRSPLTSIVASVLDINRIIGNQSELVVLSVKESSLSIVGSFSVSAFPNHPKAIKKCLYEG